jgi:hypothetical protein
VGANWRTLRSPGWAGRAPFGLPEGFAAARAALLARFPSAGAGIATILGDAERIATGLGVLSRGRVAFRDPREGAAALIKLGPLVRDWRRSLSEVFARLRERRGD